MSQDVKNTLEALNGAFEQFKVANDARLKEIEQKGTASADATAEVAKLNAMLQDLSNRTAEVEKVAARPAIGGDSDLSPEAKAKKGAFFNFMRHGVIDREMRAALVEDATGEILVPEDVDADIRRALQKETIMRTLARIRTTTSNRIRRRGLNELQVGWGKLELGAPLVESTLTPDQAYLYVEDLYGLTKIGEDELMDSDVGLEEYVEDSFSRAIAVGEDVGFIRGTGHANSQPEGLTVSTAIAKVTAGQIGAVKADDFIRLAYAAPAQYRRNGAYLLASSTELAMRLLKDANGQYLWQPSSQAGRPATFGGFPVYNQEDVQAIPTALAAATPVVVAAFGDFKAGYVIVDRLGMTIKRLAELYATQGMVGFLAHRRTTGGVVEPEALRLLQVPRA